MIWIDERRCIGEGIRRCRRWCIFGDSQDIKLRDEGNGDASIGGHLVGWVEACFFAVLLFVERCSSLQGNFLPYIHFHQHFCT